MPWSLNRLCAIGPRFPADRSRKGAILHGRISHPYDAGECAQRVVDEIDMDAVKSSTFSQADACMQLLAECGVKYLLYDRIVLYSGCVFMEIILPLANAVFL